MSPPVRGRGLKLSRSLHIKAYANVAPRAGAWIETTGEGGIMKSGSRSPPVRGRGLKLHTSNKAISLERVAPRAGAWIETRISLSCTRPPTGVAPRAGAWIETILTKKEPTSRQVAPRAGAWIETILQL